MSRVFLKATLKDGSSVVSEFTKLTKVQRYAQQVLSGAKTFNVWEIQSPTHPESGEAAPVRTRRILAGHNIVEIVEVEPTIEAHGYSPGAFVAKARGASGSRGRWTVPETAQPIIADGNMLSKGTEYPLHRDRSSWRDYIIVKESVDGSPQVRFYIDQVSQFSATSIGNEAGAGSLGGLDDDDED